MASFVVKVLGKEDKVTIKNEPFTLFGRMVPLYDGKEWTYREELFPEDQISEMCFPEEDYNPAESKMTFIAVYDGKECVGLGAFDDYWFKYFYLSDLKVNHAYRGKGIGGLIIEKAKEVAKEKGYRGIFTVGQDNNLAACRFYLKKGFQIGGFDNRVYTGTSQEGKADILFYLDN